MNSDEIHKLIRVISKSEFERFELRQGDFELRLVKPAANAAPPVAVVAPSVAPVAPVAVPAVPAAAPAPAAEASAPAEARPAADDAADGTILLTSPIVGTFYRASSPEADVFVEVGARVTAGQTLCIVEAMKMMNEIEAESAAEVVEVLAENAQPVEFGQPLFRLRPL